MLFYFFSIVSFQLENKVAEINTAVRFSLQNLLLLKLREFCNSLARILEEALAEEVSNYYELRKDGTRPVLIIFGG